MSLGFFLIGIGGAPVPVLGITYLDENSTHARSIIFTGMLGMADLMGPILGYLIGGKLVRLPGDLNKPKSFEEG